MTELNLTRRRILAGIVVLGLAAAAAGVGTFALFNEQATSSDNEITAGELSLNTVGEGFQVSELYPTQSTNTKTISAEYSGGVDADLSLNISVDNDALADQLTVESAELVVGSETVESFSSASTLSDLSGEYSYDGVLTDQDTIDFETNLTLAQSTPNTFQGQSINVTVTFNATQQT